MKLPDVTTAQILAVVTFVVGQLVAYGLLDDETSKVALSAAAAIVPAVWQLADAMLRGSRNKARAALIAAGHPDPAQK